MMKNRLLWGTVIGSLAVACLGLIVLTYLTKDQGRNPNLLQAVDNEGVSIVEPETADFSPPLTQVPVEADGDRNPAGELAAVTRIIDGDTIEVDLNGTNYRVRYIGMDTPERGDFFFQEATEANRQLVENETVILVKDVSETDRYGRLLRYVYRQDGVFVNAELVRLGYARIATFPPDVKYQDVYLQLEQEARQAGVGLWAEAAGVAERPLATPTDSPAPTPISTPLPAADPTAASDVVISFILFDGAVFRAESDEYAVITNQGDAPVNLAGWRLNADDSGQDFWFPPFDLEPGQECRVYTDQVHPETCGFSFDYGRAIWANRGECGHLYDAAGVEVSTYCY